MSEKRLIVSAIEKLQGFKSELIDLAVTPFGAFVAGYVCGLEADTDRFQEQIAIINECIKNQQGSQNSSQSKKPEQQAQKVPEKVQAKKEIIESTPPLDGDSTPPLRDYDDEDHTPPLDDFQSPQQKQKQNTHSHAHSHSHANNALKPIHQTNKLRKEASEEFDMDNYMKQFKSQEDEDQQTLDLIRQLQEEEENTMKQQKANLQADEEIDCTICLCELYTESVLPLESCDHVFHQECLMGYIKNMIGERKALIVCPFEKCGEEIYVEDFKQLLGKDLHEAYIKNSLESYVDGHADEMSWCPTPDCKYVFAFDEDENENDQFKCIMCKKEYCLKCRVIFHKGMTCKEYSVSNSRDQNDIMFEKFVKGKKFKQCIKCKFWVEKNEGCDHMTCRCKYEFCYKCGGKYRECECVQKMKEEMERRQQQRAAQAAKRKARPKPARVGGVTRAVAAPVPASAPAKAPRRRR